VEGEGGAGGKTARLSRALNRIIIIEPNSTLGRQIGAAKHRAGTMIWWHRSDWGHWLPTAREDHEMAIKHSTAARTALAALAFATVIGAGTAHAQYGGYGSGPGYGYGSGPGNGYGSGPNYGYAPRYSPGYGGPGHADLYHSLCEGNAAGFEDWQVDHLARYIKLDDNQKALLATVKDAVGKAAVTTHSACPGDLPLTWSGQLETMQGRLEAMLAAVQSVRPAIDAFVGSLSDEQKARLNAIGFGYTRYR
jgi:hypothetical protein